MYAVIDIGSNTIRLVLYKIIEGEPRQMLNSKESVGLAGYIGADNRMTPKGVQKALQALGRFDLTLRSVKPRRTFVFATASLRGVVNAGEVLSRIKEAYGMDVSILSGEEEAALDFAGAIRTLHTGTGMMADIGGGSTELVVFQDKVIKAAESLPMGSLNMFTRYISDVVPTWEELEQIRRGAEKMLRERPLGVMPASGALCGIGGTCRAACKLSDELWDTDKGYGGFPCEQVKKILKMVKSDRERLVRAIIKSAPDRLHTLLPGLAILDAVIDQYGCSRFAASPYGVREGYLLAKLEGVGTNE